jgi:hypothetical protein|tara:strand:- start:425 stop:601 length:177 start_codon:yes stop_codon:yes gene_type:complete
MGSEFTTNPDFGLPTFTYLVLCLSSLLPSHFVLLSNDIPFTSVALLIPGTCAYRAVMK